MSLATAVRRASSWHEDPRLISWAMTPLGKLSVWLAAGVLLYVPGELQLPLLPLLALALLFPERRIDLLAVGALWVLFDRLPHDAHIAGPLAVAASMLLSIGVLALVFLAARHFRKLPGWVQRHPVVILHILLYGSVGLTYALPRSIQDSWTWAIVASFRRIVLFVIWRCSYAILAGKRGTAATSRFRDHFFYFLPLWGGSLTPYGKGYDYLKQIRAKSPEEIAGAQLSGLKLLGLAWIWTVTDKVLGVAVYGETGRMRALTGGHTLGIPRLGRAIAEGAAAGRSGGVLWASVLLELLAATLELAISGHIIIGALRLFGFRAFRNTYKPLLATSLIDFWNRFFYYFKELLVEFFFFPTYLTTFKERPRLRIFAAVMAAAAVGNLYYHLMRNFQEYFLVPVEDAVSRVGSHAFYALLLGLGIFVSMLRERERRGRRQPASRWPALRRLRAIAGVWLFYALIHIWNVQPATLGFAERSRFFLSLFGL